MVHYSRTLRQPVCLLHLLPGAFNQFPLDWYFLTWCSICSLHRLTFSFLPKQQNKTLFFFSSQRLCLYMAYVLKNLTQDLSLGWKKNLPKHGNFVRLATWCLVYFYHKQTKINLYKDKSFTFYKMETNGSQLLKCHSFWLYLSWSGKQYNHHTSSDITVNCFF